MYTPYNKYKYYKINTMESQFRSFFVNMNVSLKPLLCYIMVLNTMCCVRLAAYLKLLIYLKNMCLRQIFCSFEKNCCLWPIKKHLLIVHIWLLSEKIVRDNKSEYVVTESSSVSNINSKSNTEDELYESKDMHIF